MPNTFPFYDAEPYWPKGGYGHHGGSGDDSGNAATTDFYIFVDSFDTAAPGLWFFEEDGPINLEYEEMEVSMPTRGSGSSKAYCYHYKDCPVGASINARNNILPALFYEDSLPPIPQPSAMTMGAHPLYCPRPMDGLYIVGLIGIDDSTTT